MTSLCFRALAIRRMPGISDPFELKDLADGLNVVFGPNATGKTTTSRALEALIWPSGPASASAWVEGIFEIEGSRWWGEIDAGRSRYQKDGHAAAIPNVLPVEARDRYRLPLHELLAAEDVGLARAVALESVGGFDLAEAAKVLNPRTSLSRPRKETDDLRAARERLQKARGIQEALQAEASTLREDEKRLAARPGLEKRLAQLRLVLEHSRRSEEAERAATKLSAFHPAIARLAGDEAGRMAELGKRIEAAKANARTARGRIREAEADVSRSRITAEIASGDDLQAILREVDEIESIETEIRLEDRAVDAAETAVREDARRLGAIADQDRIGELAPTDLGHLEGALATLGQARDQRAAAEAELRLLEDDTPAEGRPSLERGAFLLQQWLRAAGPEQIGFRRMRSLAIAACVLVVVSGLALALVHPAALVVTLVGIFLGLMLRRQRPQADLRGHHQSDFLGLNLADSPERWEPDAVRATLERLGERIAAIRLREAANARRQRLEQLAEDARREEAASAEVVGELAARFGLDAPRNVGLILLVNRVSKLHDARVELEKANARRIAAWGHRNEVLARCNERLVRLGEEEVGDLVSLRARAHALEEKLRIFQQAQVDLREATSNLETNQSRVEEANDEIAALRRRLEVEDVEVATVAQWCGELPAMLTARREFDGLEAERARLEKALRETDTFEPGQLRPEFPIVEGEIRQIEDELRELESVRDRVVRLRSEISKATRAHDVEDALSEVDRCAAALRDVRERDARMALTAELIEYVEELSRNEQRPEVFHRAGRLFTRITRGRYELRLEDGPTPSFRAFDTERGRSQPLDELSSATRVQLLLAVRIAFVEVQEGGIRLPLLLDETLANSDEERAAAIMDAVLALASDGRQIFYFTAQPDEVRKWAAAAADRPDVSARFIDLAAARKLDRSLDIETLEMAAETPAPMPAPTGHTHASYGALLGVPAVDPLDPLGALHLWYLLDEPRSLHQLMATLGADSWGAFRALIDHGGETILPAELVRRTEAMGAAAEATIRRLRVGHGRKIDRTALLESGAVSELFIDDVAELARTLDGQAASVLDELEAGAVPRFLHKKIEALREFMIAEGYLDPRDPLRPEQIRWQVLGDLTGSIEREQISVEEIERLLRRLGVTVQARRREIVLELWPEG